MFRSHLEHKHVQYRLIIISSSASVGRQIMMICSTIKTYSFHFNCKHDSIVLNVNSLEVVSLSQNHLSISKKLEEWLISYLRIGYCNKNYKIKSPLTLLKYVHSGGFFPIHQWYLLSPNCIPNSTDWVTDFLLFSYLNQNYSLTLSKKNKQEPAWKDIKHNFK